MKIRIDYPRLENAIPKYEQYVAKTRKLFTDPSEFRYACISQLMRELFTLAPFRYANGDPLDAVRPLLVEAAQLFREYLTYRGSIPAFEWIQVDTSKVDEDGYAIAEDVPGPKTDYSTTNSHDCLQYVYTAFATGEIELGKSLSKEIWDPPDADYIGKRSEVCTTDQQQLAYSVKHYLAGEVDQAIACNKKVDPNSRNLLFHEKMMLRAIYESSRKDFLEHLSEYLKKHEATYKRYTDSDFLICLVGLGVCSIALQSGLVSRNELPQDNVFLPLELMDRNP